MLPSVIAVDLGGTLIRTAIVTHDGEISKEDRRPTPAGEGPQAVLSALMESVDSLLSPQARAGITAIGVAAPGPVDPGRGLLIDPPNLPGWGRRSLRDPFEASFGVPTWVGNDANLGALGERRFGAGRGVDDLLYLTVGTGIGGGIVSGGRLITGWHGFAAEVGHQVIQSDGPTCGCGRRGHLEALASGPAISRNARLLLEQGHESILRSMVSSPDLVTAEMVAKAASQGDRLSVRVFQEAGRFLGLGIANLIHLLEPELVLIGGGVSNAGALLLDPVRETVAESLMSSVFADVRILLAQLKNETGILGAAALAFDHQGETTGGS